MIEVRPTEFGNATPIDSYGPGFFRIGGQVYPHAVLVHSEGVLAWGGFEDTASLTTLAGKADLLLIGTGAEIAHIPAPLREAATAAGLRIEAMASPAAARSYNVLLAEGRHLAAALIPI